MISMVGLLQFNVHAVTWQTVAVTPSSCNVGDTITVTVIGGVNTNEYRYGFRIDSTGDYIIYQDWTSSPTSTYVPVVSGVYSFRIYIRDSSSSSYVHTSSVVVSAAESSSESSAESSSEISSESSFDSMNWMPSNWQGDDYVQPSADSTPDISFSLPSDVELSVSGDMTGIISKAFQSLPSQIFVLLIPVVISLFVGWWLHK